MYKAQINKRRVNLKKYCVRVEVKKTFDFSTFAKNDNEALRLARSNYPNATHLEIV